MCKALLSVWPLFAALAHADLLSINFQADYNQLFRTVGGLLYTPGSLYAVDFSSSNPLAVGIWWLGSPLYFSTGPLVRSTDTSWIFQGGSFSRSGFGWLWQLPSGYSTCEDAGLTANQQFDGTCWIDGKLSGTVIGDVAVSLTNPASEPVPTPTYSAGSSGKNLSLTNSVSEPMPGSFTSWQFSLTAPVTFTINRDLAIGLDISRGPYSGSFTVTGTWWNEVDFFLDPPPTDPGFDNPPFWRTLGDDTSFVLSGITVPEPSSWILLAPVLFAVVVRNPHKILSSLVRRVP